MSMRRFIAFDRQDNPLFDLDGRLESATRTEKLNGEHKLDIITTQALEEGVRLLVQDGTEKWREWVIDEPDESHDGRADVLRSYGCTWSMQYDLASYSGGELWPGTYSPITAGSALRIVLNTQSRWEVGNVTLSTTGGTSLYDGSVWDYLGKLVEVWGGEIEPRIVVDSNGVVHRYVDWLAHVGQSTATRRFDYGEDCTGIRRKPAPGPRYCRVIPRGGKDATDDDGVSYSERVGVEEEPYQADSTGEFVHPANASYIEDTSAAENFRTPDGNGGWHYPAAVVIYDSDDPEELLSMAMDEVESYTRPVTTYEADVLQFAAAGMDAHGVQLGDEVQIVDRAFGSAPLRLEARVVEMTVNELDDSDIQLVIGDVTKGIETSFKSIRSAIDSVTTRVNTIAGDGTIVHLQNLIEYLNSEINATGGYWYAVPGYGTRTYDVAVSDPEVGSEASQVVEVRGGSIRIANSRTSGGDWDWKTVFVSGHIAAELVTAAAITAGYIGNASGGSYWDLDNDILQIANTATLDGNTVSDVLSDIDDAAKVATNYLTFNSSNGLDIGYNGTSAKTRINAKGMEVYGGDGVSAAFFGIDSNSNSYARIGNQSEEQGNVEIEAGSTDDSMAINLNRGTNALAQIAYGLVHRYGVSSVWRGPFYTFGSRASDSSYYPGYSSFSIGESNIVRGTDSFGGGSQNEVTSDYAFCYGYKNEVRFRDNGTFGGHAIGKGLTVYGEYLACGTYNYYNNTDVINKARLVVGGGTSSSTYNAMIVYKSGDVTIRGTLTQSSDRRLKNHIEYLSDDACKFVRSLKPALFAMKSDGTRRLGFYAQDVQSAEPEEWDTETVHGANVAEEPHDMLALDYTALIAPLVAYTQSLEKKIETQQEQIDALISRIEALEARA